MVLSGDNFVIESAASARARQPHHTARARCADLGRGRSATNMPAESISITDRRDEAKRSIDGPQ